MQDLEYDCNQVYSDIWLIHKLDYTTKCRHGKKYYGWFMGNNGESDNEECLRYKRKG